MPCPPTGELARWYVGNALPEFEFESRTGEGNYYLKIEDCKTNKPIATVFIRDGDNAGIKVPPGDYRLKYAVGSKWYGSVYLFGPGTYCAVADKVFNLQVRRDGQREIVDVETISLFKQEGGNLKISPIPLADF